jgi:hypothetical protein
MQNITEVWAYQKADFEDFRRFVLRFVASFMEKQGKNMTKTQINSFNLKITRQPNQYYWSSQPFVEHLFRDNDVVWFMQYDRLEEEEKHNVSLKMQLGRNLATAATWHDIPLDNRLMILRSAREQRQADRYRARVLRFQFRGYIALADHQELQQALEEWSNLYPHTPYEQEHEQEHEQEQHPLRREQIVRRLETRLRAVFDTLFRSWTDASGTPDELNLTAHAWAQVAFRVQAIRPEELRLPSNWTAPAEIRATSPDGLHRLRLVLCRLPVGGPFTCVNISYYGPQRFRTFDNYDYYQARGGDLREYRAAEGAQQPLAPETHVPHGLDDPRVFQHWHAP